MTTNEQKKTNCDTNSFDVALSNVRLPFSIQLQVYEYTKLLVQLNENCQLNGIFIDVYIIQKIPLHGLKRLNVLMKYTIL